MLDFISIENELNEVSVNFSRVKIEQLDKDIVCVLRKSIKDVEGQQLKLKILHKRES